MSDVYINFNDLLTAVGNMLKEIGEKEVTIPNTDYDLSGFCDKLYEAAYQKGRADACESGCKECKYFSIPATDFPCCVCSHIYFDMFEIMKGESE